MTDTIDPILLDLLDFHRALRKRDGLGNVRIFTWILKTKFQETVLSFHRSQYRHPSSHEM